MQNVEKFSYWEQKSFFKSIDFIVIGAGIVGYSTALHLRNRYPSAHILVLERGILPSGASSKNAGFACFGSATELYADLQSMPEDEVWKTVAKRWQGLQYLRALIGDDQLRIQFNGSWDLITAQEADIFEKTVEKLDYFNEKLAEITGETNVYSIDPTVNERFGFEHVETSIYNRLEGQIDTASMNKAFYKLAVEKDINVLFGVDVAKITPTSTGVQLTTNQATIEAKRSFICTNGFAQQFISDEKILPARAQVIITAPIPNLHINGTFHYNQGYYYFRNIDDRILFGGGRNLDLEGETTTEITTTAPIINSLKTILREVILPNTPFEIEHQWAGIMGIGLIKTPIIKECLPHTYCGVRLGGMGVAIGTLVGKELADLCDL